MPNYGYSAPRWHPFPGTTPSYTPKKKDIGISTPAPAPPAEPEAGVSRIPLIPSRNKMANSALATEESRPRDVPSFPISPVAKASVGPDIRPIDVDEPR
jgi:hypothetical protein